jgi:hypothetical protein
MMFLIMAIGVLNGGGAGGGGSLNEILLEDGTAMLLEDGTSFILE